MKDEKSRPKKFLNRLKRYRTKRGSVNVELLRAKLALEASREGVWDWNLITNENTVSESWAQMIGFTAEEVNHTYDFFTRQVHPEDMNRMVIVRDRYLKGQLPVYHTVFRMISKDGQVKWILSRGRIVDWDAAGKPLRMVGTHQDITRQKRVEEALKRQKAVLESFFRYSPDAMAHLNTEQQILQINEQFTRMFGYTQSECYLKVLDELIADESLRQEANEITRQTERNETIEVETVRVRKDGSRVPVVIRGGPVIVEGEIVGYQGIYTDITQRKNEEAQLWEAKQRAEAANQVKSRFLSNMSHEIRTPMNGIHGAAMLLETTHLSQEQLELVQILKDSSNRMMDTITNLLDVSRIEAGRMKLREEVFELHQTFEEVMESFRVICDIKQLGCNLEACPESHARVVGDRSKLVRILYHLISNAFKFTSEGRIDMEVSMIRFEDPIAIYRFSVTDTGIGIQSEDVAKLFRRFYQLDDTYAKSYQGTGLGLAIVQELVEIMGGRVSVESVPGAGSCFSFQIPLRVHEFQSPRNEEIEHRPLAVLNREIRILAVEDDEISQSLLRKVGRRLGAQVDVARDGFEAIRQFGTVTYDLVLMDVQLPTINGIEVTAVIRSFEKKFGERTPIIGLSAHALMQDRDRCLEAGMNDYLSKPVDFDKLYRVIQEWVR